MSRTTRSKRRGMTGYIGHTRDGLNGPNQGPGRKHKQPLRRADRRRARMAIKSHYEPMPRRKGWSWMLAMWW